MKILIIENETLVRAGIRSILAAEAGVEIIGEAETSEQGLELFKASRPDVTLMSLRLRETCAIDDVKVFLAYAPQAKIIIIASRAGDGEIVSALEEGALGFILRDTSAEELIKAVQVTGAGKRYIPDDVARVLGENLGREKLTQSEKRVLGMLVGGMSNKEIAYGLQVSENTVKTHVKNLFEKLGVSDRTSATLTAIRRGLVRVDL
jgi:DNA-binding NarL/FixJ family response regulator